MPKESETYRKHYDWVKKQINLLYPPPCSPLQLIKIAKKERKAQENLPYEFEKHAPGKHKIRRIIEDKDIQ